MTTHHVVTTLNKPTSITSSVKGKFIKPSEDNLILSKGSCIEVYTILSEGISLLKEINLYGFISKMEVFTIPNRDTCSLFILTDQNYYTILSYDAAQETTITEGSGVLEETNARVSDQPIAVAIDLHTHTILISAFTGILFSIPFHKVDVKGKSKESRLVPFEPASIRTNEFDFISMVSLKGVKQSSIAVLLGETNELKTIKSFKYSASTNEIVENEKLAVKVESTTHTLIAVPDPIGGVLAIGEYIISYHNMTSSSNTPKEISIDPVLVTAYTFLNDSYNKCILGDLDGTLYLLTLEISNMFVVKINSTVIGQVSFPNSIIDLGNDMLYIGSSQGDPCIAKIHQNPHTGKYSTEIMTSFSNLGPIVDFCLFDYDQQGKKTMVCCSGVDKDGSLRIVENGIGFLEKYNLEFPLASSVWSLRNPQGPNDTMVISTCYNTVALKQSSATEVEELSKYSALVLNETTLALASSDRGYIVQVTPSKVNLIHYGENGSFIGQWTPPAGEHITMAKATATECVICCGRGTLVYLECADTGIAERGIKEFADISCINLGTDPETLGNYVLVSTWTNPTIYVWDPMRQQLIYEKRLESVCPKDLQFVKLEKKQYLMVLLGNGQLLSYLLDVNRETNKIAVRKEKQTMVGTYCTGMYPYMHQGRQKLFITGSRPTIVASFNQNLYFSTVNIKDIFAFSEHNEDIVLMTDNGLLFGQIDANQKLHHTKITLESGMPNRIQYMGLSKSIAVGTILTEKDLNNGFNVRKGKVQILDAQTFQPLDTYSFPGVDLVECMTVATFAGYPNQEYLFVGTVVEDKDDPDSSSGHIFVFEVKDDSRLELIESIEKPGIIYDMRAFQNSVIACVNGSIYCLNKFRPDLPMGERVAFELNVHKNVLALSLDTRKDKVLVGDLMKSLSVLSVTSKDPLKVELTATDTKPAWTTAVKFINDNVFMGADDRNNIFVLALDERSNLNTTVPKLALKGGFHIGSLINCFRDDTLMDASSSGLKEQNILIEPIEKSFTFATVHGSIGTIKTISQEAFEFFFLIQESILRETKSSGGLDYYLWRQFKPKINSDSVNNSEDLANPMFLDGNVLKQYLTLPNSTKLKIISHYSVFSKYRVTDLENLINSLISVHK